MFVSLLNFIFQLPARCLGVKEAVKNTNFHLSVHRQASWKPWLLWFPLNHGYKFPCYNPRSHPMKSIMWVIPGMLLGACWNFVYWGMAKCAASLWGFWGPYFSPMNRSLSRHHDFCLDVMECWERSGKSVKQSPYIPHRCMCIYIYI